MAKKAISKHQPELGEKYYALFYDTGNGEFVSATRPRWGDTFSERDELKRGDIRKTRAECDRLANELNEAKTNLCK